MQKLKKHTSLITLLETAVLSIGNFCFLSISWLYECHVGPSIGQSTTLVYIEISQQVCNGLALHCERWLNNALNIHRYDWMNINILKKIERTKKQQVSWFQDV